MKTVAITAVVGALVAIPFLFGRRKPEALPIRINDDPRQLNANLRYDVDDFLTE
jgi:hypothetical protein